MKIVKNKFDVFAFFAYFFSRQPTITQYQLTHDMKHNYLKIVITAKNQTQYFLGDGVWFGRISKDKFESKLAVGCVVFEAVNHAPKNIIQFTSASSINN